MSIKSKLDSILAEATGEPAAKIVSDETAKGGYNTDSSRPADKSGSEPATKIEKDGATKVGGGVEKDEGHGGDQNGTLDAKAGTKVNDPAGKVGKGQGTEVQGNTDTSAGLGEGETTESVSDQIKSKLQESVSFKLDLSSIRGICEAQELGEDFANSAAEIFESVANDVLREKFESICESATAIVVESIEQYAAKLEEDVDAYLDSVVTEWADENRLAIIEGSKSSIAESFMVGMKDLMREHFVSLPESEVSMYESALEAGQAVLDKLHESEEANAELQEQLAALQKLTVVESFVSNMSDVRAEKIRALAEDIQYTGDVDKFYSKLSVLSEGYTRQAKAATLVEDDTLVESTDTIVEAKANNSPEVDAAARALSQFVRR